MAIANRTRLLFASAGAIVVAGLAVRLWLFAGPAAPEAPAAPRPRPVALALSGAGADDAGVVAGHVLGADGRGVRCHVLAQSDGAGTGGPSVETDAAGAFALPSLPFGRHVVWAWSDDGDSARAIVVVSARRQETTLRFAAGGPVLAGTVADAGGGVLVGASIVALGPAAGLDTAVGLTLTDGHGRYRLRLPAGRYLAAAAMTGYARVEAPVRLDDGGGLQDFRLLPAAQLGGRVVRADGTPAAATVVMIRPVGADTVGRQTMSHVTTDAAGRFTGAEVEPGRYRLFAEAGAEIAEAGPIQVAPGERRDDIALRLAVGLGISGRLQTSDGNPVAGAVVSVVQDREGITSRRLDVTTDGSGRFSAPGLRAESTTLLVDHPAHLPVTRELGILAPRTPDTLLVLTAARRLQGQVRTRAGEAVAGAQVWAAAGPMQGPTWGPVSTGADGRFTLRLPPSVQAEAFRIGARHERLGIGSVSRASGSAAADIGADVVLDTGRYIEGVVVDPREKPVAFVRVAALNLDPGQQGGGASAVADAAGAFRLGPLSPGTIAVRVQGAYAATGGGGTDQSSSGRTLVALSAERDSRGIVLHVPARDARLAGRVLDPDGHPIDGAVVLAAPERHGVANRREGTPALSDADGRFGFDGLAAGPYQLFVDAAGFAPVTVAGVVAPDGQAQVHLRRFATVSGVITEEDGHPSPGATVRLIDRADGFHPAGPQVLHSDGDGRWDAGELAPGPYLAQATTADGRGHGQVLFTAGASAAQSITIIVTAGRTIIGRVVQFETGAPIGDARVQARGDHGSASASSGSDGRFTISGVPRQEGAQFLHVDGDGARVSEDYRLDLPPEQETWDVGTLRLVANAGASASSPLRALGLRVVATTAALSVSDVTDDSPAAQAGFKAGMHIVKVQGGDATGLGVGGLGELVARTPAAALSVRDDQAPGAAVGRDLVLAAAGRP